jgi:hypothetical protein
VARQRGCRELVLLLGALQASCGGGNEDEGSARGAGGGASVRRSVTYHRDLRPVIESSCFPCHAENGIAPFSLTSYEELRYQIPIVVDAVSSGHMPPWSANDDCHPLADSRRMSDATRALFGAWRDDGMPEGDPAEYVAPTKRATRPPPGEPTRIFQMAEPYSTHRLAPGEPDEHRCFLLPETFERDTFFHALAVQPSSNSVHHLQVHRVPADSVASVLEQDAAAPGLGYPCFTTSAPGAQNLYSWHPGSEIIQFGPDGAGFLPAGARIVLQIHFNLDALLPQDPIPEESTKVELWTLPEGQVPSYVVERFFLNGGLFHLPPGASRIDVQGPNVMEAYKPVGISFIPGEFVGHTPHMHWLGTAFDVKLQRQNGEAQCLIDLPKWDFHWQLDYWYPPEHYVPFGPKDVVTVHCVYDNSVQNQPFVGGVQQVPRDVYFGEASTDEMCLNHTWVRYRSSEYLAARLPPGPPP